MDYQNEQPVSLGNWMLTIFLAGLPLVGLIMLFIWAFGGGTMEASKANWAKATLLWMAIGFVLTLIIWGIIIAAAAGSGAFSPM